MYFLRVLMLNFEMLNYFSSPILSTLGLPAKIPPSYHRWRHKKNDGMSKSSSISILSNVQQNTPTSSSHWLFYSMKYSSTSTIYIKKKEKKKLLADMLSWEVPRMIIKRTLGNMISFSCRSLWTNRWIRFWLDGPIQSTVANSSESQWLPVTSDVPQGSILSVLLNIFINDIDKGTDFQMTANWVVWRHTWSTGCHPESLGQAWDVSPWESHMRFEKTKRKVLHLDQIHPVSTQAEGEQIKSSPAEKDFWVLADERLNMTQHCALMAQKAKVQHQSQTWPASKVAWPGGSDSFSLFPF